MNPLSGQTSRKVTLGPATNLHVIYAVMWAWLLHNNIPSGKHFTSIQEIGFICSFTFRMMPPYCMAHQEPWISLNIHNRDERKRRVLHPAYKAIIKSPGLHGCYAMPRGTCDFRPRRSHKLPTRRRAKCLAVISRVRLLHPASHFPAVRETFI